jgi:hypothetical protein
MLALILIALELVTVNVPGFVVAPIIPLKATEPEPALIVKCW